MSEVPMTPAKVPPVWTKEALEWGKSLVLVLVLVFLIRTFVFTMIRVDGTSMTETLHNGDRLAVTILDMKLFGPQRFDIVICTYPGEDHLCVKRVIGLPGETIEIKGGVTYINGQSIEEPFVTHSSSRNYGPYEIPEGHYFVMGDNRANSKDSTAQGVGALAKGAIGGKVRLRCWPFDQFGMVE